jgi:abhydrolase domain-containing protein 17
MGDTVSTLLFQPPSPSKLKEHKIVWLNTSRGSRIPGFYISYRRQGGIESCRSLHAEEIRDSQPELGITLLYSHANAEDLGSIYPWCKFLSKMLQVNLFAYDYSGYGMANGCGKFTAMQPPFLIHHPLLSFHAPSFAYDVHSIHSNTHVNRSTL